MSSLMVFPLSVKPETALDNEPKSVPPMVLKEQAFGDESNLPLLSKCQELPRKLTIPAVVGCEGRCCRTKLETITPVPSQELCGKPTVEAALGLNDPLEAVVDMA
jgi:hypothetical protein